MSYNVYFFILILSYDPKQKKTCLITIASMFIFDISACYLGDQWLQLHSCSAVCAAIMCYY